MFRWLFLAVSVIALLSAFKIDTPGMLALTLLIGFGAAFAAVVAFAAARVETVSQGQSTRELSMLLNAKKQRAPAGASNAGAAHTGLPDSAFGVRSSKSSDHHDGDSGGGDGGGDGGGGGD